MLYWVAIATLTPRAPPPPVPALRPLQVGFMIYWVAVAAVLYSAGTPAAHWRAADQYQPKSFAQLSFANDSAPAMAARPDTANLTGWVCGSGEGRGESRGRACTL